MFIPSGPPDAVFSMGVCTKCKHITIDGDKCEKCNGELLPCGQVSAYGPKQKEAPKQE